MQQVNEKRLNLALNKLAKWRIVFASWQLGTRAEADPECQAVKDHREVTILLRTELNALLTLLMGKGVFTDDEWALALAKEAETLDGEYERRFPGFSTSQFGVRVDPEQAYETARGWRP